MNTSPNRKLLGDAEVVVGPVVVDAVDVAGEFVAPAGVVAPGLDAHSHVRLQGAQLTIKR